ncbi:MAG: creatininase family protein [Planctomycetota bacterium]
MARTYRYEEMLPRDLARAVKEMPVFFFSTGLLEWHGEHLPLGQDALKAHGIALAVARKLGGGVVLPPHYWGRPGFSTYLGTFTFSEPTLWALFTEVFEQLVKAGARVIVLLTGHYGDCQVDFVQRVSAAFAARHPKVRVIAQPEYEGVVVDGEVPADHAGKFETSMFRHLYPELTHMENFRMGVERVKKYEDAPHDLYREPAEWEWGEDLTQTSSPELGERCVEAIAEHLAEKVERALSDLGLARKVRADGVSSRRARR